MTKHIVFAHKAGRSHMAAAFFNRFADPAKARASSAGTSPGECVHPEVVDVMLPGLGRSLEVRPQRLTVELARTADWLITIGSVTDVPSSRASAATTGRTQIRRVAPARRSVPFATRSWIESAAWSRPGVGAGLREGGPISLAPSSALLPALEARTPRSTQNAQIGGTSGF